jgi:hypothetical protein
MDPCIQRGESARRKYTHNNRRGVDERGRDDQFLGFWKSEVSREKSETRVNPLIKGKVKEKGKGKGKGERKGPVGGLGERTRYQCLLFPF